MRVLAVLAALAVLLTSSWAHARECTTTALLELQRRPGIVADLGIGDRPSNVVTTHDSAVHPLRVHATTGVTEARALLVLGFLEAAWDAQVTGAGFPAPLSDGTAGGDARFDAYVVPLPDGVGGVSVAEADASPNDGKRASPGFMQLDPSLPDDLLEVYAWHELQHALQFAIDVGESLMWIESTAVFWEVRARPDVTDWHAALPDFQGEPQLPIFAVGTSPLVEYGAVLFPLYLDEEAGDEAGAVLADIWAGCAQPDAADGADEVNEPDFLDAMPAAGIDVAVAVADFSTWRALVGPFEVPGDGPVEGVPAEALVGAIQLNPATLDGDLVTTDDSTGPYPLGCAVHAVDVPANVDVMPVDLHVEATLDGQQVTLGTVVVDPDADTATRVGSEAASSIDASVEVPRGSTLIFTICDVTGADPDDAFEARPVRFSILRTDVEFPDAGPPADADAGVQVDAGPEPAPPPPDCSCQSTSTGPAAGDPRNMRAGLAVVGMLVGIFGFGVRGYRAWKRRRLYKRG